MELIAQYKHSIMGTVNGQVTVDIVKVSDDLMLAYSSRTEFSNTFSLTRISKNDYNQRKFEEFLKNPSKDKSGDIIPLSMWRAHIVESPEFKSMEYYQHIFQLDEKYNRKLDLISTDATTKIKNLSSSLEDYIRLMKNK